MLQPQMALRGLRLPFRCLPSIQSRANSAVAEASSSSAVDQRDAYPSPPASADHSTIIKKYTPRTPGIRHLRRPVYDHLWKGRPVHRLTFPKRGHGKGGRNNSGKITAHRRGGGHKRRIRMVDFTRNTPGPHLVERIEYDPGRTAHIALLRSKENGRLSYILAPDGLRPGEMVQSYTPGIPEDLWKSMGGVVDPGVLAAKTAQRGNCLPLHMIPVGSLIFNIGLYPGKGGILCRSAGTFGTVLAKGEDQIQEAERREHLMGDPNSKEPTKSELQKKEHTAQHVTIRLRSGEVRLIHKDCSATIGIASNPSYQYAQYGKAGRSRWKNIRPTVRGVAKNAADHPHGGGRGKSKGNVDPKSPWGIPVCIYSDFISFSLANPSLDQERLQDSSQAEDQPRCGSRKASQPGQAPQEKLAGLLLTSLKSVRVGFLQWMAACCVATAGYGCAFRSHFLRLLMPRR